MFKIIVTTAALLFMMKIVYAQGPDPNQAVLDKFLQFPRYTRSITPNSFPEYPANYTGECAAAIEKQNSNLGEWNMEKKTCMVIPTEVSSHPVNLFQAGVSKGEVKYRMAEYEFGTRKAVLPPNQDDFKDLCQLVIRSLEADNNQWYVCVKFEPSSKSFMLVRNKPISAAK